MAGGSDLTGPQKAAVVILAAGADHASRIFSRLEFEEIKDLTQAMASLGMVSGARVEAALKDFGDRFGQTSSLVGSFESAERLLTHVLDADKVATIMDEVRGPAGRTVWDKLGNVNETVLASFLKNEYPQTVAVVLSRIKPDHAARVIASLPEDVAIEAVMRMLRMEVVQKEVLSDVENTLRTEFMTNQARTQRRDNHEVMAEIFNYLDRSTESKILDMLEERHRESADKVRALMFTFEDLARLDALGIQTLLREIDTGKLAIALKGASQTVGDLFLANMSDRAAKIMREDMENMGPVRVRDVEEAQTALVSLAKELAASGEIFRAENKEDEMIY
jgi:flagellar motor switch protein FliG